MLPDEFLLIVLYFLFCFLVFTYPVASLLILMPSLYFFSLAHIFILSYLCFYFNVLLFNKHVTHLHLFHPSEHGSTVCLILCVVPILSIYPHAPLLALPFLLQHTHALAFMNVGTLLAGACLVLTFLMPCLTRACK